MKHHSKQGDIASNNTNSTNNYFRLGSHAERRFIIVRNVKLTLE